MDLIRHPDNDMLRAALLELQARIAALEAQVTPVPEPVIPKVPRRG